MSTVFLKLKTMVPVVFAPDIWSAVLVILLAVTVTPPPPTAVGTALVPALSTIKLLAVVEAVTVNAGDAARSAGPLLLVTVKALPVFGPTEPSAPAAGQEAVGVE